MKWGSRVECKPRKHAWVSTPVYLTAHRQSATPGCGSAPYRQCSPGKVEIRPEPTPYLTAGETSSTHTSTTMRPMSDGPSCRTTTGLAFYMCRASLRGGHGCATHRLPLQGGSGTQAGITVTEALVGGFFLLNTRTVVAVSRLCSDMSLVFSSKVYNASISSNHFSRNSSIDMTPEFVPSKFFIHLPQ